MTTMNDAPPLFVWYAKLGYNVFRFGRVLFGQSPPFWDELPEDEQLDWARTAMANYIQSPDEVPGMRADDV